MVVTPKERQLARDTSRPVVTLLIGAVAGISSGLLGVGGGIIMVPLLTTYLRFSQHRAHATSLAAIIPIAAVGAARFAMADTIDYALVLFLALGAVVGAPFGERAMARSGEALLKTMFGVLLLLVAFQLLWP